MRAATKNPYVDPDYADDQWSIISSNTGSGSNCLYDRALLEDEDSLAVTSDEEDDGLSDSESDCDRTEDEGSRDGVTEIMSQAQKVTRDAKSKGNIRLVVFRDPLIYEASSSKKRNQDETHDRTEEENVTIDIEINTPTRVSARGEGKINNDMTFQLEEQIPLRRNQTKRGFFRCRRLAQKIRRKLSSVRSIKSLETEEPSNVEREEIASRQAYQDVSVEVAGDGVPLMSDEKPIGDFVLPPKTRKDGALAEFMEDDVSMDFSTKGYEIETDDVELNSLGPKTKAKKGRVRRGLSFRNNPVERDCDSDTSVSSRRSVASRISTASRKSLASIRSRLSSRRKNKTDAAHVDFDDDESKETRKRKFFARLREKKRMKQMYEEDEFVEFCEDFTDTCYFFQCVGEEVNESIFRTKENRKKKRRRLFLRRKTEKKSLFF